MKIPLIETARQGLAQYRARYDGSDPKIVNFPSSALIELHHIVATSARECVFQLVPFHVDTWQIDSFDSVVWREVAKTGLRIKKIYVLPHRGIASELLNRQLELDSIAGIDAHILVISNIPQSERTTNLDNLWIIDQSAIVIRNQSEGETRHTSHWTVSEREADLRNGIELWNKMWSWSEPSKESLVSNIDLEEPLVSSADLINGVAPVLCVSDQVDGENCSWYHSVWQYLRLLDMVSTPSWHARFFLDGIVNAIAGIENVKILVTGAADYSMVAYVRAGIKNANVNGEIGIIDKCPTPLFACRWYAKRLGFNLSIYEEDLFDFSNVPDESIDLICTDSFLTRFIKRDANRVLSIWHRLLKDGGKVITTVRVHPIMYQGRDIETAIHDFRERATQRAVRWGPFIKRSPNEIGQMAESYARKMRSENLGDKEDICRMFKDNGFIIIKDKLVDVLGELYPTKYIEVFGEKQGKGG